MTKMYHKYYCECCGKEVSDPNELEEISLLDEDQAHVLRVEKEGEVIGPVYKHKACNCTVKKLNN